MAQVLNLRPRTGEQGHPAFSRILLSGKAFVADVSGALYWPAEETLIVSDLRLGASSEEDQFAQKMYSRNVRAVLGKLSAVLQKYDVSRLVVLGDSLPDLQAVRSLSADELRKVEGLQTQTDLIWVGEDVAPDIAAVVGGAVTSEAVIGGVRFRRNPVRAAVCHEIAGGSSPEACILVDGRMSRSRCFVSTGTRLVLPAFVDDGHGRNVLDADFGPIFNGDTIFVWIVGWSDIRPVAARQLLED